MNTLIKLINIAYNAFRWFVFKTIKLVKVTAVAALLFILTTRVAVDHRAIIPLAKFYYAMYDVGVKHPMQKSFVIQFLPALPYNNIAYAYTAKEHGHICVSEAHWFDLSPDYRELAIYHEMLHNVLGVGHDYDETSIMFPRKTGMIKKGAKDMTAPDAYEMLYNYLKKYKDEN